MSINANKFVRVTSKILAAQAPSRDLSGLVISEGVALDSAGDRKTAYDAGKTISVSREELPSLFGEDSAEYRWALCYFSFVSPSGTTPARLKFKKIDDEQTSLEAFKEATGGDESFGSFVFLGLTDVAAAKAVADYNAALNNSYRMVFDYSLSENAANHYSKCASKSTLANNLYGISGLTLCSGCSYLTMARLAATDYTQSNSTGCDMFKTVDGMDDSVLVADDAAYEALTALRLNFVGLVKEHGASWKWYMRGVNMDGTDTACYDNETWFKSEIIRDLLELQASVEKIPANERGVSMVSVRIQKIVNMAISNGTILPGKPLSSAKQATALSSLGGDSTLLDQLLDSGWALIVSLDEDGEGYAIRYKVAYLKGAAVRFVDGSHIVS